ncbi:MAG: hypothetical protein NZ769_01730 [Anaerolineae bacterium]|nr:hypothetical protein [Anaerolineae bacterium]
MGRPQAHWTEYVGALNGKDSRLPDARPGRAVPRANRSVRADHLL